MARERTTYRPTVLIATFLTIVALKLAEDLLAPILLAMMMGIVISPVSRFWEKLRVPPVAAALMTLTLAVIGIYGAAIMLEPTVSKIVRGFPEFWEELKDSASALSGVVENIENVKDQVNEAIHPDSGAAAGANSDADQPPPPAPVPNLTDLLFYAPALLGQLLVFFGTLFFFVLCKTEAYAWLARQIDHVSQDFVSVARLEEAERFVARYFLTVTVINIVFGVCVMVIMRAIGLPGSILWGLGAFLLNYIPYLGPIVLAILLFIAGQIMLDGAQALFPPAAFLLLNLFEGYFATPTLVGKSMRVNPLLIFLSLTFWLWLWGPVGGFMALPLVIWGLAVSGNLVAPQPTTATAQK